MEYDPFLSLHLFGINSRINLSRVSVGEGCWHFIQDVGWLVVFNVPSTMRSFRDGTPIYCPLPRTWSSAFKPSTPRIEPWVVARQFITQPLRHASSIHPRCIRFAKLNITLLFKRETSSNCQTIISKHPDFYKLGRGLLKEHPYKMWSKLMQQYGRKSRKSKKVHYND